MRISDWSSDVCSSDLTPDRLTRKPLKTDFRYPRRGRDDLRRRDQAVEVEGLGDRGAHQIVAVDDVDMHRHHVEDGQRPEQSLNPDDQRQPFMSSPNEQWPTYRHLPVPPKTVRTPPQQRRPGRA